MSLLASKYLRRTFCLSRSTPIVRNFTASGSVKGNNLLIQIKIFYIRLNIINLFQLDIVQSLYIKELKSYKPTQAVN